MAVGCITSLQAQSARTRLEKSPNLEQAVARQLRDVRDVLVLGVVRMHRDDLRSKARLCTVRPAKCAFSKPMLQATRRMTEGKQRRCDGRGERGLGTLSSRSLQAIHARARRCCRGPGRFTAHAELCFFGNNERVIFSICC